MTLVIALFSLLLVAVVVDRNGLGRVVHRTLIERPARTLNAMTRARWIGVTLFVGLGTVLTLLFEADGFRLFSMAAPDLLIWATLFDVGVVVEITLIAVMLAGRNGIAVARSAGKVLLNVTRHAFGRIRTLARNRTPRRPTPRHTPRSDDDLAGLAVA